MWMLFVVICCNVSNVQQQPTRQRAQSIMPCTVGQITKAEQIDDKFLIGNIELNQVLTTGILVPFFSNRSRPVNT